MCVTLLPETFLLVLIRRASGRQPGAVCLSVCLDMLKHCLGVIASQESSVGPAKSFLTMSSVSDVITHLLLSHKVLLCSCVPAAARTACWSPLVLLHPQLKAVHEQLAALSQAPVSKPKKKKEKKDKKKKENKLNKVKPEDDKKTKAAQPAKAPQQKKGPSRKANSTVPANRSSNLSVFNPVQMNDRSAGPIPSDCVEDLKLIRNFLIGSMVISITIDVSIAKTALSIAMFV